MSRRVCGPTDGRGKPLGYDTWYDWAIVWRYWHRQSDGLRSPYLREQAELLRLGRLSGLSEPELAERIGVSWRTICRWSARLRSSPR